MCNLIYDNSTDVLRMENYKTVKYIFYKYCVYSITLWNSKLLPKTRVL